MGFPRQPGCWLRSSHTFKECVIAHWSRDPAPKISGAKFGTEAVDPNRMVEEHCVLGRSYTERSGGLHTRENAGMSSER